MPTGVGRKAIIAPPNKRSRLEDEPKFTSRTPERISPVGCTIPEIPPGREIAPNEVPRQRPPPQPIDRPLDRMSIYPDKKGEEYDLKDDLNARRNIAQPNPSALPKNDTINRFPEV